MNFSGILGLAELAYLSLSNGPFSTSGDISVTAGNSFTQSNLAAEVFDRPVSSANSFSAAQSGQADLNSNISKSAGNSLSAIGTASEIRDALCASNNATTLSSLAYEIADLQFSLDNSFTLANSSTKLLGVQYSKSAANSFSQSNTSIGVGVGDIYVSAGNSSVVWNRAQCRSNKIPVSCSNAITLTQTPLVLAVGSKFVASSNDFEIDPGVSYTANLNRYVSASNAITVSQIPYKIALLLKPVSGSFTLRSSVSEVRDISRSSSNTTSFAGVATTTNLKYKTAGNTFVVTPVTTGAKFGRDSLGHFTINVSASARISLPWRKNALTRLPGGNIPHS